MTTAMILRKTLMFIMLVFYFGAEAFANHDYVEIDVWADHGFENSYCEYDEFDLYLRPDESCYVTILVVDPHGYANVIYPANRRHQRRLHSDHIYRLSDLLDEPLYFYGIEGRAQVSVIATRRPVFLNNWLLDEVRIFSHRPYQINAFGIRIAIGDIWIGNRFSVHWSRHIRSYGYGIFTTSIVIDNRDFRHYHHNHNVSKRRNFARKPWDKKWTYRSHNPIIAHNNRKDDTVRKNEKKRVFEERKRGHLSDEESTQQKRREETSRRNRKKSNNSKTEATDKKVNEPETGK